MTEGIPVLPGKGGKQLEGVIPIAFLEPNGSGMTCHGRVLEVLRSEVRWSPGGPMVNGSDSAPLGWSPNHTCHYLRCDIIWE